MEEATEEATRSEILPATRQGAVEADVTNQNVYGAIRTLFEQGVNKKTIARQLGLDVKTVRKCQLSRDSGPPISPIGGHLELAVTPHFQILPRNTFPGRCRGRQEDERAGRARADTKDWAGRRSAPRGP
jgi:hypothetical protein